MSARDEFGLTLKQRKFCDYYLISGNGTDSAIKAGYSKKTAYAIAEENLRKLEIKAYIDKRRAKHAEKLEITQEMILKNLLEVSNFCKQIEEYPAGIGEKTLLRKKMIDAQAVLRANELLGKTTGIKLFVESKEVKVDAEVKNITDKEEKLKLAKQIALSLINPEILDEI